MAWNLGSLVVVGVCGIAINVLTTACFGAARLGVFNQVMAIYLIASQLAVGGFAYSTLALAARAGEDRQQVSATITAAILLLLPQVLVTLALLYFAAQPIGVLLDSAEVAQGLHVVLFALAPFAVNKTLMYALNGMQRMPAFATAQALRFVAMLSWVGLVIWLALPPSALLWCFLAAELLLLPVLIIFLAQAGCTPVMRQLRGYLVQHFQHGRRAFFAGLLQDTNSRVDVVMLGLFASDRVVGIYSFAAMLAEGLLQVVVAVQNAYSPRLSRMFGNKDSAGITSMLRKTGFVLVPVLGAVVVVSAAIYAPVAEWLLPATDIADGWLPYLILSLGFTICAPVIAVGNGLNQFGRADLFSLYLAVQIAMNVLLNTLLIPLWGMSGAAAATAISWLLSSVHYQYLFNRTLRQVAN